MCLNLCILDNTNNINIYIYHNMLVNKIEIFKLCGVYGILCCTSYLLKGFIFNFLTTKQVLIVDIILVFFLISNKTN